MLPEPDRRQVTASRSSEGCNTITGNEQQSQVQYYGNAIEVKVKTSQQAE